VQDTLKVAMWKVPLAKRIRVDNFAMLTVCASTAGVGVVMAAVFIFIIM
jgi:hypothetical protein